MSKIYLELIQGLKNEFQRLWDEEIEKTKNGPALQARLTRERAFISDIHAKSSYAALFFNQPPMMGLMRQMIGPDVDLCYNQLVIKAPSQAQENLKVYLQSYEITSHHEKSSFRIIRGGRED